MKARTTPVPKKFSGPAPAFASKSNQSSSDSSSYKPLSDAQRKFLHDNDGCFYCRKPHAGPTSRKLPSKEKVPRQHIEYTQASKPQSPVATSQGPAGSTKLSPESQKRTLPHALPVNSISTEPRLLLSGAIQGVMATILIDSGASENFISDVLVENYRLPTHDGFDRSVTLADGTKTQSIHQLRDASVKIGRYREKLVFNVLPLDVHSFCHQIPSRNPLRLRKPC